MYINCKLKNIYMAYSLLISFFLRTHTSRTPLSGCFRPNAAVFLKPPVVMPQELKKRNSSHYSRHFCKNLALFIKYFV